MFNWRESIRRSHPDIADELIKILERVEPDLFHCNCYGGVFSPAYFKEQGGVTDDDDENICDNCYEV
jgi:hypothetical protein